MAMVPTDPYELLHWNMKLGKWVARYNAMLALSEIRFIRQAHQTYVQGYDVIVKLLTDTPKDDLANVLGYFEAWVYSVLHHHDTEARIPV